MQDQEEQFEIFTEAGQPVGQASRSRVHAEGLWHRSAQVFLFDGTGRLVMQRRVAEKDVCGGLWDQSVAEHLLPGETYLAGAIRGLAEELGVTGVHLRTAGELAATRLDLPELGIHDWELQQAFTGSHTGPITPDPTEVAEIRMVALPELIAWIRDAPENFTPWFLRDVQRCNILPATRSS